MTERNRAKNKLAARHRKEDEKAQETALKLLLNSFEGRRFLWAMLEDASVFRSTFAQNALETAFNAGQHNAGLKLLNQLMKTEPGAFTRLIEENQNVQRRRNADYAKLTSADDADDPGNSWVEE